jgi:organic hydroperoxide reductase OsmC/OhrA
MQPYPHQYVADANGGPSASVSIAAAGAIDIETDSPVEFGGPGGTWSPETLLCAAVADCFVLTFRALAKGAKLDWTGLRCTVTGTLQRAEGVTRFTRFATHARLTVPIGSDVASAHALLEKAEQKCLVSNSLNAERILDAEVIPAG